MTGCMGCTFLLTGILDVRGRVGGGGGALPFLGALRHHRACGPENNFICVSSIYNPYCSSSGFCKRLNQIDYRNQVIRVSSVILYLAMFAL